jgi:CheY-like chemotaxis protein
MPLDDGVKTRSLSVVIIDDDPEIIRMVTACLQRCKCSVNGTLKAKEGVDLVRKINPDVILCDAEMSGLSGAQVIEILKSDPATALIPVILITGFAGPEFFSHVQWTGFLSKPFSQSELIAALHHAVATAVRVEETATESDS